MYTTTSYGVRITDTEHAADLKETLLCYRGATEFLLNVISIESDRIRERVALLRASGAKGSRSELTLKVIENLAHRTKNNPNPKHDFDGEFPNMPSYLRRSAINDAIGAYDSYASNLKEYNKRKAEAEAEEKCLADEAKKNGKTRKPKKIKIGRSPKLTTERNGFPTLYGSNMFIRESDYTARIKVLRNGNWVWIPISFRKGDADYILKHKKNAKTTSPTLEKRHKVWELRFAFTEETKLTDKKDIIIGVDLGVNNAAACTAVTSCGTVIGRKIFSFPREKGRISHGIGIIRKKQRLGAKKTKRLWDIVNGTNKHLSDLTANGIMKFAEKHNADIIVFEHLSFMGKTKGVKKQRLTLWRKKEVQGIVERKAHLAGMRISRVNAWNTSRLAFDGSGEVKRDPKNHSICEFKTGKKYHADLNAAYNIGARYFAREITKSLPEQITTRLKEDAKVSSSFNRTTCTLSDLINLNAVLKALAPCAEFRPYDRAGSPPY
jgi:IS605 OrfB family transposase